MSDSERLLDVREAAALLHVSKAHLYADTRKGKDAEIPHVRVGRFVRYRRCDLEAWIAARVVGGSRDGGSAEITR